MTGMTLLGTLPSFAAIVDFVTMGKGSGKKPPPTTSERLAVLEAKLDTLPHVQTMSATRFWGTVGAIGTAVGLAITLVLTVFIPGQIDSRLVDVKTNQAKSDTRLAGIESTLIILLGDRLKSAIQREGKIPEHELQTTRDVLVLAKQRGVILDPQIINQLGELLLIQLDQPDSPPGLKDTLLQVVNYRSFLNAKLYPTPPSDNEMQVPINIIPGQRILIEDQVFVGVTQKLDWGNWRDVVFRNCVIKYDGNPVRLENVHFENCHFEIITKQEGQRLSRELLASVAANVDIS